MRKKISDFAGLSDEELMRRYSRGDISGFDQLYYRYSKRLFYFFFKATNHREKSEDLLQDLFFKIAKHHLKFDYSKKFSTWIYSIANNLRINEYRKNSILSDETAEPDDYATAADNLETVVDKILTLEKLNEELMKLPQEHKMCFLLRFKEDFSVKETAEIMNCPEGTVKSRIYHTLIKLNSSMIEYNPKFEVKYEKEKN